MLTIRKTAVLSLAALLGALVFPFVAAAQTTTAQLIVVTQTSGTINPSSATVMVTGTGPSLTTTPTSSGSLTYSSSFNNETRVVTMIPGSYAVSVPSYANYGFSYSNDCTGYLSSGQVKTCTIVAGQGGTARVNVSVNVVNSHGGLRTASDFVITVSGQNTNVSSFQGSTGSVQVSMGPGSYSIDAQTTGSYTVNRSSDCSGTIASGETRSCTITLTDYYNYNNCVNGYCGGYYGNTLSCAPSTQTVYYGQTASFTATGGSGPFTWTAGGRNYFAVGPQLNTVLGDVGTQTVTVSNGYQTASCTVTVLSQTYPGGVYVPPGQVLGNSTVIPGLPNTGYAPNALGLMLALLGAFVAFPVAIAISYPYAKRATATFLR